MKFDSPAHAPARPGLKPLGNAKPPKVRVRPAGSEVTVRG